MDLLDVITPVCEGMSLKSDSNVLPEITHKSIEINTPFGSVKADGLEGKIIAFGLVTIGLYATYRYFENN